jgi:internalin A
MVIANAGRHSIALLMVAGMLLGDVAARAQPVSIIDPNLEAAVREALNLPDGVLTVADMQRLLVLQAPGREITSLAGFEGASSLVELDLRFNKLTGITTPHRPDESCATQAWRKSVNAIHHARTASQSPPPGVGGEPVGGYFILVQRTRLTRLELPYNDLPAFDLGVNLPQLEWLDLGYNRVSDMGFLNRLPQLSTLILDDNGLRSFSPPLPLPKS